MQLVSSSTGPTTNRPKHRRIRVFRQIIIGCGIALVSTYALKVFGVEVATRDLVVAFAIGMTLIILAMKIQPFRRIPRVH